MEILKIIIAFFVAHNVCATVTPNNFIYESVKLEDPCPHIRYITNYDMNGAIGWWYRVYTESNNALCFENQGQTMYAAQYDNATIQIVICCQSAADPSIAICGRDVGSGIATPGPKPGTLTFHVQGEVYTIYVLRTDYHTTGLAYGCKRGAQNERDEVVFVLSRGYKLDRVKENEIGDILKRIGIPLSSLIPIKQGDDIPQTAGPVQNKSKV